MCGRSASALVLVVLLAGCLDATPTADAELDTAEAAPAQAAPATGNATLATAPPAVTELVVALDGRTGTYALACAPPVGCTGHTAAPGDAQVLFEGVAGRPDGGELSLTWTATSPATETMSFGVMTMYGGEACEGIDLGVASGRSPLVIDVAAADRALCPEEVLHIWVSGGTDVNQAPFYATANLDQPFHLEGALRVVAT